MPAIISTQAFEKLFREQYEGLCRGVFRIVRDRDIAEDIVQEAFLSLWKKRASIESHESLAAYLHKSAVRRAFNHLQREKNLLKRESFFQEAREAARHTTDEEVDFRERARQVQDLINSLPPACRTVFVLSRYEQMSYREIADSLGISVNTVENHMAKALKFLRKRLLIFLLFFFRKE